MPGVTLTLCLAVAAGVSITVLSQKVGLPAIVLLLVGGILLGPEALGWVQPAALGGGLRVLVGLIVAVILFEGGLTLDLAGFRQAPTTIKRLLTYGVGITWFGTALATAVIFRVGLGMALMVGSLVIVTGPTVIGPILRRLRVSSRVHHTLYWESVLIDAVGVFMAVLCYEWLEAAHGGGESLVTPVARFVLRVLVGGALGLVAGLGMSAALKRGWVAKGHVNIFALAGALGTFGIAQTLLDEAGVLAVVVAGLVIGVRNPPQLKYIRHFKLQLAELGVGTLFILLAAQLEVWRFRSWDIVILLGIMLFVLRPLSVLVATRGEGFSLGERTFLSWMAPRGIVAAAMASLFTFRLQELGFAEADLLETVTYSVIGATVILQGLSAPVLVRWLRIGRDERPAWVLAGDDTLVDALQRGLRRAGVATLELPDDADTVDPDELAVRLSDAGAALYLGTPSPRGHELLDSWSLHSDDVAHARWTSLERRARGGSAQTRGAGEIVWARAGTLRGIVQGLRDGSLSVDVLELGEEDGGGRFDEDLQPLFWVKKGRATIVVDPLAPGTAEGDCAVVLSRNIDGLRELLVHVDVVQDSAPTLEGTLRRGVESVARLWPDIPIEETVSDLLTREQAAPSALGDGVAIPHAYVADLSRSLCALIVLPSGLDLGAPDGRPVRLVFLLLSPRGEPEEHLESMAVLTRLASNRRFMELLSEQTIPERLTRLVLERARRPKGVEGLASRGLPDSVA